MTPPPTLYNSIFKSDRIKNFISNIISNSKINTTSIRGIGILKKKTKGTPTYLYNMQIRKISNCSKKNTPYKKLSLSSNSAKFISISIRNVPKQHPSCSCRKAKKAYQFVQHSGRKTNTPFVILTVQEKFSLNRKFYI